MNKGLLAIVVIVVLVAVAWFLLQKNPVIPAQQKTVSFNEGYRELLGEIRGEPTVATMPQAVARFENRIDSLSMATDEKAALRDLTSVYSSLTAFLVFSDASEQSKDAIESLDFGEYCEYKQLFLSESDQEKKAIDSLEALKKQWQSFQAKYPDRVQQLNFAGTDFSDLSTTEWKKSNDEKAALAQKLVTDCGGQP